MSKAKLEKSKTVADGGLLRHEGRASVGYFVQGEAANHDLWELAYSRFETPEEEIRKFVKRLRQMGAEKWPREAEILELFCGRGSGLHALNQLGFTQVEGADLSRSLIAKYKGPAKCYVCDCRQLRFDDRSKDILVIHGGLHHLQMLPEDLQQTLSEINRVLRDNGLLGVVEPWLTPFLSFVHMVCQHRIARRLSNKVDALATMIQYERETYEQWLREAQNILDVFDKFFQADRRSFRWGKFMYVGRKKHA
jgi:ubiquinone/menaquinone biosynthesis C-methylase UbiE